MSQPVLPLVETLKKAATVLRETGIPFALAGGGAAFARGAAPPLHDVDFVVMEKDVDRAAEAFAAASMRIERPPEGWLIKAFDGEHMIDLIHCLGGEPVSWQLLDRAEELDVAAMPVPVLSATDLVLSLVRSFSAHHADFTIPLIMVRAMREQVDWAVVRKETKASPFGRAFLVLLEGLEILPVSSVPVSGPAVSGLAASSPGPPPSPVATATDDTLAGRLEHALATDPRTHELAVRVEMEGGAAYLRGEVASEERRRRLSEVAREVIPELTIHNQVDVIEVREPK
ncbi:MAG TPA: nucleotidyltransferase [Streptosporangiaceae bacterium]